MARQIPLLLQALWDNRAVIGLQTNHGEAWVSEGIQKLFSYLDLPVPQIPPVPGAWIRDFGPIVPAVEVTQDDRMYHYHHRSSMSGVEYLIMTRLTTGAKFYVRLDDVLSHPRSQAMRALRYSPNSPYLEAIHLL